MTYKHIERALKTGGRLHAFRSGGGLRVVRIEKNDRLIGYGEHAYIEQALVELDDDLCRHSRKKTKARDRKVPRYLTGASTSSSLLDGVILVGHTFDMWHDDQAFVAEIMGRANVKHPEGLRERVLMTGKSEKWHSRGFTYETTRSRARHAGDSALTGVIKSPPGRVNPWMYPFKKSGRAESFQYAIELALVASEVEIPDDHVV